MNKLGLVLFAAVIGCGDDGPSMMTPDAAPPSIDGAVDSGPACGGAGTVTVVGPTYDPTRVTLTMSVVSHDSNGFMCGTKDGGTGSEAHMTIDVPPSGMVTMIVDNDDGYRGLYTWTEVQPGDELLFPSPDRGVIAKTVSVDVTVPPLTGASEYEVFVQCENGGGGLGDLAPVGAFTKDVECRSDATAVAVMIEATSSTSSQYAVSAITAIAASGATTVTVGAYMPAALPTVTVHGTAGFDRAYVGFSPAVAANFQSVSMLSFANVTTDPVTLGPRALPPTWTNHMNVAVSQSVEPRHTLQRGVAQTTPMSLDVTVTTDFMPLLSAQLTAGLPRPSIAWSTAKPATADAVYVNAGNWLMVTRAQPGTVRFPEVPASLLPTVPAEVKAINLIDGKTVNGFDDLRHDPLRPYNEREFSVSTIGDVFDGIVP